MRLFDTDDLFTLSNYTLDKWTNTVWLWVESDEQFSMDFYLTYMVKWPDMFFAEEAPNGQVVGIGIGKVEGERDDAKLGTVTLKLFWKADVAGGKSSYEVVRHAVRPRLAGTQDVNPDRRFDVTLLINGLPLIQFD